jgi:hypothetical protein
VRISLAVDDKLSVDRFESDDLIVFGALSVIVRIFTVAAYAISAVENLFEIAVALNIVEYSKTRVKYFIVETKYGLCKITEKDYLLR